MLEPRDWHVMDCFSQDAILLVLSNQYYGQLDYIDEPYLLPDKPVQHSTEMPDAGLYAFEKLNITIQKPMGIFTGTDIN